MSKAWFITGASSATGLGLAEAFQEGYMCTAHVDGDYDKRGLPEPLALALHFALRGNEIVQLIILPNHAGT